MARLILRRDLKPGKGPYPGYVRDLARGDRFYCDELQDEWGTNFFTYTGPLEAEAEGKPGSRVFFDSQDICWLHDKPKRSPEPIEITHRTTLYREIWHVCDAEYVWEGITFRVGMSTEESNARYKEAVERLGKGLQSFSIVHVPRKP